MNSICGKSPFWMMRMMMNPARAMKMASQCQPMTAAETPTVAVRRDIVDTALAAGIFQRLMSAVISAGLGETLKGDGPFTVFAPTDEAFGALGTGVLEDLQKPENRAKLTSILTYHVVPGRVAAADLVNLKSLATLNGKPASVRVDVAGLVGSQLRGFVLVEGAKILKADIEATNGIVHAINKVLIPSE